MSGDEITQNESATGVDLTGYVIVHMPDGSVHAVAPESLPVTRPTAVQDGPGPVAAQPEPDALFYVHLADGSVELVKEKDLPAPGGTNSPMGHWRRGDAVFHVIGIYPAETQVKE